MLSIKRMKDIHHDRKLGEFLTALCEELQFRRLAGLLNKCKVASTGTPTLGGGARGGAAAPPVLSKDLIILVQECL